MTFSTFLARLLSVLLFAGLGAAAGADAQPTLQDIPDQYIAEGALFVPIELDDYVTDDLYPDGDISWTFFTTGELTVSISERVVTVSTPGPTWFGSETVIFRGTNPASLWAEDTVTFTVEETSYRPLNLADWQVSTPANEGLDPNLVMETYHRADTIPHLYSWLICKNGRLVAEKYYHGKTVSSTHQMMSATKSVTSILAGISLSQGYISSLDQPIKDFFPEVNWSALDPRKSEITVRQILQMRSGYPFDNNMITNWTVQNLVQLPLSSDPGTEFAYSNASSYFMGVAIARAAVQPLQYYGYDNLFEPLGMYPTPYWAVSQEGYNLGFSHLNLKSRDMAKIGQLYLDGGKWQGSQLVPVEWVAASLTPYSLVYPYLTEHVHTVEYGYNWWLGHTETYSFWYAWGHGGQLIVLVPTHDIVVVATADPLMSDFTEYSWVLEGSVVDLAGRFISELGEPDPVGCCFGRVGNANGVGDYPDEITIGDVQTLVTAKFIQGKCDGYVPCIAEGDVNQSGGVNPTCDDITISDIQTLVNHLFIVGPADAPLDWCL